MALKNYSLLKGRVSDVTLDDDASPHIEIRIEAAGVSYRVAVNVRSQISPHDLLFLKVEPFIYPLTPVLQGLTDGITNITRDQPEIALDYVRGELVEREAMSIAPFNVAGANNDLKDYIVPLVQSMVGSNDATVYAFGESWGPEPGETDKYFGFLPGNGIHDIHMNQGSRGRFAGDNGVNHDGALVLHDASEDRWVALFLAFQSQDWQTDPRTGHPTRDAPITEPAINQLQPSISIVAALIDALGDEEGKETVTLLNRSDMAVDLSDWTLEDDKQRSMTLFSEIKAGDTRRYILSSAVRLSNNGGVIYLKSPDGSIAHTVMYRKSDVNREGWTTAF